MKSFLAVTLREVHRSRFHLPLSGILGLMALVAPPLAPAVGSNAAEVRTLAAFCLALVHAVVFCILWGGSSLVLPLVSGRLAFDFVRPIPGPTIALARLAAAGLVLGATFSITMAPAIGLLGSFETLTRVLPLGSSIGTLPLVRLFSTAWPDVASRHMIPFERLQLSPRFPTPLAVGGLALIGLGLSHLVAFLSSARTRWIVLDLVGALAIASLVASLGSRLAPYAGSLGLHRLAWTVAAALPVGLVLALLLGLVAGRTSRSRSHAWQSPTLWICLAVPLLGLDLRVRDALGQPPDRLSVAAISESGSAIVAGTRDPGLGTWSLWGQSVDGEPRRLGPIPGSLIETPQIDPQGRFGAWLTSLDRSRGDEQRLYTIDLKNPEAVPQLVTADALHPWLGATFAFDEEGLLGSLRSGGTFVEVEPAEGQVLRMVAATPRVPGTGVAGVNLRRGTERWELCEMLLDPERDDATLRLSRLEPGSGTWSPVREFTVPTGRLIDQPESSRVAIRGARGVSVFEIESGALLFEIPAEWIDGVFPLPGGHWFVADDSGVSLSDRGSRKVWQLLLIDPEGTLVWNDMVEAEAVRLGSGISANRIHLGVLPLDTPTTSLDLFLASWNEGAIPALAFWDEADLPAQTFARRRLAWETRELDLASGTTLRTAPGFAPSLNASGLLLDHRGHPWRWTEVQNPSPALPPSLRPDS